MNNIKRGRIFFLLGLGGLLLTAYVVYLGFQPQAINGLATMCILLSAAASVFLASCLNLYMAFGFYFGCVDRVVGTDYSASLIRDNRVIRENVRIRLIRPMDQDDLSLTDEQRPVFFLGDGFPWVCSIKNFRYESK